ncbi:TPA_asm: RNA-directed RNA polymerase [ssRNA phage SRR7976325_20]|uniref:RNA-directed RNA polymerase n=1 Tax=ssRNA phage SRR7976325_20 TaxID=2786708 RepID=A0A8S5L524_9VIRU|nr:RNA-directed RNA polymerase [ssRNA phage SRR7976325_20]DAD52785.1 TPA_asm: RNA-directed RNA polymerase [ssRNA phage SRR7976325_20]
MKHLDQRLTKVLKRLCAQTNTPFSRQVSNLLSDGKVVDLFSLRVDPRNYETPASYYQDAVIGELLRKYADYSTDRDLKAEARALFAETERRNKASNVYLKHLRVGNGDYTLNDVRMVDFLSSVRKKVSELMGPLPRDLIGRFGKGSTFGDIGKYITVPDKMSTRPTITRESRDFLSFFTETAWFRSLCVSFPDRTDPEVVRGNRFTSVNKEALKERGICIEAGLNVYFQLAVGSHWKDRLKRKFGYCLYTAQDRHRHMARVASLTGRWATVDLRNASDLFSYELVRAVCPSDWFELLCCLRATHTEVNGKWHKLEKFSSMGNGFTFELMTIILTAICLVLGEDVYSLRGIATAYGRPDVIPYSTDGDISVFGDDIICPPAVALLLLKCLPALGLEANEKKTFLSGNFRESCGGDFFLGVDVRAYNLERDPFEQPASIIGFANAIRRLGRQHRSGVAGFRDYSRVWMGILDALPNDIRRLRGPEHLGDLVIHDSEDQWNKQSATRRRTPDQRTFVRGWVPVAKRLRLTLWSPETQLASALYGVPSSGVTPRLNGEDVIRGYRKRWLAVGW